MEGSAVCKVATVGIKPNSNRDGLVACDLGSASFGAQGECTAYEANGQYADETGLAACKTAPAGIKPTSNRQGVESCELGSASSGAEDECTSCDGNGQYADELGLSACKTAPAGTKQTIRALRVAHPVSTPPELRTPVLIARQARPVPLGAGRA